MLDNKEICKECRSIMIAAPHSGVEYVCLRCHGEAGVKKIFPDNYKEIIKSHLEMVDKQTAR